MSTDLPLLGHAQKHTADEKQFVAALCSAYESSALPTAMRLQNFTRHVRRQDVARFLAKVELFKLAMPAHGSIIECGVYAGGGLATWLHCTSIFEPYNHMRRIVGFDTFEGFPHVNDKDLADGSSEHLQTGALKTTANIRDEIEQLIHLHDRNRPLGHLPKVELVPGDACKTVKDYVARHPHLLVSLLYLDFDIYEPTKAALEALYMRVVKGGIVAFDQLNCPEFPGETTALLETLGAGNVQLRRFPFDPCISYFIKGD